MYLLFYRPECNRQERGERSSQGRHGRCRRRGHSLFRTPNDALLRPFVDFQTEDVGAGIVTVGIKDEVAFGDHGRVEFRREDAGRIDERAGEIAGVGAMMALPPLWITSPSGITSRISQAGLSGNAKRPDALHHIAAAKIGARRQHKAPALEGVVTAGKLMQIVRRGPLRHVDDLGLGVHRRAGQRHPMLPTDKAPKIAERRGLHTHRAAVTAAPYQTLGIGGDELADARPSPARRVTG